MILALLVQSAGVCQSVSQSLQEALRTRIRDFPGTVSLYAKNLDTGVAVGIRESDPVRTASTIKLPIMLAVFDAVARGQAKWTEPLTVTADEKVSGTGILGSEISDGVQLPMRDVLHLMIVLSDNTATNMILERFTADSVNTYLDKLGIRTTRVLRKIRGDGSQLKAASGWSAAGKIPENQKYGLGVSTPRDMAAILEKLERDELVSPDASREMIVVLKRCQDATGIRRRMGGLPVANKTGSLDALRSDVGIVYSRGGRIVMAITVDGMPKVDYTPDNAGSLLIADLAKMLVDGLARQ
ncbi:MAG: class A beta-lactamase-related serine hydrolase [Acidobacteriia bacterium]|nr:class A beta-lactamase-related serine hydrolase [Terriglobia bacterium]